MDKKNYRHYIMISVIGGKGASAEVKAKIDAIGKAWGPAYYTRGKVNRSLVVLDLVGNEYDALEIPAEG